MGGPDQDDDDPAAGFDDRATEVDKLDAVPEVVNDTTGKYPTLQGQEVVQREVEIARARAEQMEYDLTALKLWLMSTGRHPDVAQALVERFAMWAHDDENDRVVRAAMRR